jgi:AcrR family transcriptional regulator
VNVAAVNYHFGDKERLYVEAVKRAHLPSGPDELLEWPPGTPPEVKLRDHIDAMLRRMLSERTPWQRQLMNREMLNPTFACRELVEVHIRARFGQLLDILQEILPADCPVHKRHQIAFSVAGQALHYHVASELVTVLVGEEELAQHYQIDQLVDHITQFSLAAMGLAPSLASSWSQNDPVTTESTRAP